MNSTVKNGKKICRGATHKQPVWLPIDRFYRNKTGKRPGQIMAQCKRCDRSRLVKTYRGDNHGWVYLSRVRWIFIELVIHCGQYKIASKLTGIDRTHLVAIATGEHRYVQRHTVRLAISGLRKARKLPPGKPSREVKRLTIARKREQLRT